MEKKNSKVLKRQVEKSALNYPKIKRELRGAACCIRLGRMVSAFLY